MTEQRITKSSSADELLMGVPGWWWPSDPKAARSAVREVARRMHRAMKACDSTDAIAHMLADFPDRPWAEGAHTMTILDLVERLRRDARVLIQRLNEVEKEL